MKKFVCLVLLLTSSWFLCAELNPPHRHFELGVDVDVALANSWFPITDFFQETLVVDFSEMSKSLYNGLTLNFDLNANAFINVNVGSLFRMSMFGGVDGTGQFNLSQGLIDFLAKGNAEGDNSITAGAGIDSLLYAQTGVSFQTFMEKWGISFSPAVFVPVVYIPHTEVVAKVEPIPTGGTKAYVNADAAIYSIVGIEQLKSSIDASKLLNMDSMGLDVGIQVEYGLFSFLDLGFSVQNIPIAPGHLRYKTAVSASYEYDTNTLLDSFLSESDSSESAENQGEEPIITIPEESEYLSEAKAVRRPTYIGFAASYRPFGEWFNVRGNLEFVINKPFYVNFHVGAGFHLLKMSKMGGHLFNFTITTGYEQRMWTHALGLILNFRAFELDLAISSRSGDFLRSFMGSGLGVGVGVRLGF